MVLSGPQTGSAAAACSWGAACCGDARRIVSCCQDFRDSWTPLLCEFHDNLMAAASCPRPLHVPLVPHPQSSRRRQRKNLPAAGASGCPAHHPTAARAAAPARNSRRRRRRGSRRQLPPRGVPVRHRTLRPGPATCDDIKRCVCGEAAVMLHCDLTAVGLLAETSSQRAGQLLRTAAAASWQEPTHRQLSSDPRSCVHVA